MAHFFPPGFPVVEFHEPEEGSGLVGVGGELTPDFLISAYGQGVFPWYDGTGPVLWWSPDPRFVLFPEKLHIAKRLERRIHRGEYQVTVNNSFEQVIRSCASVPRPGQEGTWITSNMIKNYIHLHALGYAHSFESWYEGNLVGGLYGVSVGSLFCGESMFTLRDDAGKVAFVRAVQALGEAGCALVDCQMRTPLLESFGAEAISRVEFLKRLGQLRDHSMDPLG